MSLMSFQNLSANNYVSIVKEIEQGCATLEQWAQLSDNMIFALPWRLLQCYPDGLEEVKARTTERLIEDGGDMRSKDNADHGINRDEEPGWNYTSLASTQQLSRSETIESDVLAYIKTMQGCETSHPYEHPNVTVSGPARVFRRPRTRDRIEAFRAMRIFTKTQFGNGNSMLRRELLVDGVDESAKESDGLIKLDSFRLANAQDEYNSRISHYADRIKVAEKISLNLFGDKKEWTARRHRASIKAKKELGLARQYGIYRIRSSLLRTSQIILPARKSRIGSMLQKDYKAKEAIIEIVLFFDSTAFWRGLSHEGETKSLLQP
ncbi:hypothetical protein G6011_04787 [Alternaria panax]|uniref:Uncharacterized protein n=1 Tax=Alternaria panax TaxID=48097 RepID=A0AAD4NU82_9PLEO|nr:hypothetical protein G6011_04787 [Alternaria panax]